MLRPCTIVASLTIAIGTSLAGAEPVLPAVEDFEVDAAAWRNGAGDATVDWNAAGGIDGGGYVSTSLTMPDPVPEFGVLAFRGQDDYGSSGGIFEGDWIAAGVTELSFWVRHDAAAPLNVYARFAGPLNFPGAVGLSFAPILPEVWTQVTIDITPSNPAFIYEGSTFDSVFSDIGHLQIGVTGDAIAGTSFTLDLDRVALVPAPGALALLAGGMGLGRRRRR